MVTPSPSPSSPQGSRLPPRPITPSQSATLCCPTAPSDCLLDSPSATASAPLPSPIPVPIAPESLVLLAAGSGAPAADRLTALVSLCSPHPALSGRPCYRITMHAEPSFAPMGGRHPCFIHSPSIMKSPLNTDPISCSYTSQWLCYNALVLLTLAAIYFWKVCAVWRSLAAAILAE